MISKELAPSFFVIKFQIFLKVQMSQLGPRRLSEAYPELCKLLPMVENVYDFIPIIGKQVSQIAKSNGHDIHAEGTGTGIMLGPDGMLADYMLYCSKCRYEIILDITKKLIIVISGDDIYSMCTPR